MKPRLFANAIALAGAAVLLAGTAVAADMRGLPLKIRASEASGAGIVEEIQLYADSHALVIGIDAYNSGWPRLSKAVEDAKLVAAAIEKKGFDVKLVLDPNSEQLTKAFEEFFILKGQNPEARLFVWYAGHGHTERGEGFLVPADAPRPEQKGQFRLKALALRRIGEYVRMAESKHAFAVFDSCFSGTVFDSARALPPSAVTRATTLPVRQFLTSGDAGQTVSDDGTFRELFLRALEGEERADANGDGYVTASEMGLFLTDRVTNLTQSKQTPRYGKLRDKDWDRGDFVFSLPQSAMPAPPPLSAKGNDASTQAARVAQETAFWETIKASNEAAAYAAYLQQYPNGAFASLAQVRLDAAKSAAASQRGAIEAERLRLEAERRKMEEERAAFERKQQLALATRSEQGSDPRPGNQDAGKGPIDGLLTADEIRTLLSDNSGTFTSPRTGATIKVMFGADGSMKGLAPNGTEDSGTWWMEDQRFCRKWTNFAKGHTSCFKLKLNGNEVEHYVQGGRLLMTVRLDRVPEAFATARR